VGIFSGLHAAKYDRSYSNRQLLARILGYFRPKIKTVSFIALLIVLSAIADITLQLMIARGINSLTTRLTSNTVVWLVLAILISGVLTWVFRFLRHWYTVEAVSDVQLYLHQEAFEAAMARDMSFYDENRSGAIISRITSDTQGFIAVVPLVLEFFGHLLLVLLFSAVLLYINLRLALVALAIVPVFLVIAQSFRRVARFTTQQSRRILAQINANIQETISGISVAKSFRQEKAIFEQFDEINKQAFKINLRQAFTMSSIFPTLATVEGVVLSFTIYYGGLNVLSGQVSAGEWFLFWQAVTLFWFPLTTVVSFWSRFQEGMAASERVFSLIDAEPQVCQVDCQPVPELSGRIEFNNVDFYYHEQEVVLKGFNLTVEPRETVALVGHTGAGKSSLGRLVARFYEFQGGEILIDGHDIRTLDLRAYRRHLGIVPQEPFLFSGTVADNIRYARPGASDEAVLAAAYQVGGGGWIEALSLGLDTPVGERGEAISVGQRQLVALARVLLQDPAIVILDEAMASVDPLTEADIQGGLETILKDRTAMVIAHRLFTVKRADRIIVLREGEIIEEGNHDTLISRGGHYAELYNLYFRHQATDYVPPDESVLVPSLAAGAFEG